MKKLIIISGVAGSGKTYIGKKLAKRLQNTVYLDKDTMTKNLVDKILINTNHKINRENNFYINEIRPLEYKCLLEQAKENLETGNSCIISAPFIKEIYDNNYFKILKNNLKQLDTNLKIIWIYAEPYTTKKRIKKRHFERDYNKLNNWNEYINTVKHERKPNNNLDIFIIDNRINSSIPVEIQLEKAINYIKKEENEI